MTTLLQHAFEEAQQMPEGEQDALAEILLAEIASDRRWNETFAATGDALDKLADEALAEFEAGQTVPLREAIP